MMSARRNAVVWGILALCASGIAVGAVPGQMNVQGQLLNAEGAPVDGTYSITFTLYDGSDASATAVWTETKTDVLATNGVFDEILGDSGTPLVSGVFALNPSLWLGVKVEAGPGVAAGGDPELPRRPFATVGYAFQAAVAGDLTCQGCVNISDVAFATLAGLNCADGQVVVFNGGAWGCASKVASATTADTASVATNVDCVGCVEETELAFNPATQAELDSVEALANGLAVTSVNGLAGGTITSSVTVTGSVAAETMTQNGNTVCDSSGNCGDALSSLGCQNGQVPTFQNGSWTCGSGGGAANVQSCTGNWQVLQWNGSEFVCVDVRKTGLSQGEANQYEVVDPWGYAWDGQQRAPKTWEEAKADCEADGGRLPTITELFRVSHGVGGTGAVGDPTDANYLWTFITEYRADRRVTVRISDGVDSNATVVTATPYRCVWPDESPSDFTSDNCFGAPGEGCSEFDSVFHVDRRSRPAVDLVAALHECRFYNAQLVTTGEAQQLIQREGGWLMEASSGAANQWHWAPEPFIYNGSYAAGLYRWTSNQELDWSYTAQEENTGSYAAPTSQYRFRCIGRRNLALGANFKASPACYANACATVDTNGVKLIIDATDRPVADHATASETCRALGAELPSLRDYYHVIHNGLGNGTNSWLWTSEAVYWYSGNYGYWRLRFDTDGANWISTSTNLDPHPPTSTSNYRCVWRGHAEPVGSPTVCGDDQVQTWNGSAHSCADQVDGTSCDAQGANCKANPGGLQFIDDWGNAWDLFERAANTYTEAKDLCELIGARLPTATEIYRVRANQTLVDAIGETTSTNYLWTLNPDHVDNTQVTIRVSDGVTSALAKTGSTQYRCVWPASSGNVFGGRQCYGETTDTGGDSVGSCYQAGHVRIDKFDRALVSQPSAAWECAFFGGRLPTMGELGDLIHSGAPNGSNAYLWVDDPVAWYTGGNRGYHRARWTGIGAATWMYGTGSTHTVTNHTTLAPFRCVYSDRLD